MGWKNMKNRIIDVFKVVNRLLVITVENPDFEALRVNQFVKIGDKRYIRAENLEEQRLEIINDNVILDTKTGYEFGLKNLSKK